MRYSILVWFPFPIIKTFISLISSFSFSILSYSFILSHSFILSDSLYSLCRSHHLPSIPSFDWICSCCWALAPAPYLAARCVLQKSNKEKRAIIAQRWSSGSFLRQGFIRLGHFLLAGAVGPSSPSRLQAESRWYRRPEKKLSYHGAAFRGAGWLVPIGELEFGWYRPCNWKYIYEGDSSQSKASKVMSFPS